MPDVFHQVLKFDRTITDNTDDLGVEIKFPLTLPARETENKAIVTEILGIRYDLSEVLRQYQQRFVTQGTADGQYNWSGYLSFRALVAAEVDQETGLTIGDVNILDKIFAGGGFHLTTSGAASVTAGDSVVYHDLTFGTGLGRIIPGDRIFYNARGDALVTDAPVIGIEIIYRQQLVGFAEWRGILAGYQQDGSA